MSGNHTDEQIREFKGIYNYFGESGEKSIDKKDIDKVLRAVG